MSEGNASERWFRSIEYQHEVGFGGLVKWTIRRGKIILIHLAWRRVYKTRHPELQGINPG